ncbi:MAG: M23 family metallopeptidase [Bacilli bacterium]|nr:M23 family metallopeptidase [Bacilli bacterium]
MDPLDSKFLTNKEKENKKDKKNYLVSFFNKVLVCFILVITCLILFKSNSSFKEFISNNVYQDNISFAYLNNLYNKYFGDLLPNINNETTTPVFNEKLEYNSYNIYLDGYKLSVSNSYLVPIIESGIVVFMGNIEGYGESIIIEGIDGVDIWYSNILNPSVKLYDYVTKGSFLGEVNGNELYLVFERNQEYLKFDEYIKN